MHMLEIRFCAFFFLVVSFCKDTSVLYVPPYLCKAGHEIAADPSMHCNLHEISSSEIL